jgi:hypothetical protein
VASLAVSKFLNKYGINKVKILVLKHYRNYDNRNTDEILLSICFVFEIVAFVQFKLKNDFRVNRRQLDRSKTRSSHTFFLILIVGHL